MLGIHPSFSIHSYVFHVSKSVGPPSPCCFFLPKGSSTFHDAHPIQMHLEGLSYMRKGFRKGPPRRWFGVVLILWFRGSRCMEHIVGCAGGSTSIHRNHNEMTWSHPNSPIGVPKVSMDRPLGSRSFEQDSGRKLRGFGSIDGWTGVGGVYINLEASAMYVRTRIGSRSIQAISSSSFHHRPQWLSPQ